jgi:uncharacterized protein (DUF342 family)
MHAFFSTDSMQLAVSRDAPAGDSFQLPDQETLAGWLKRIRAAGVLHGIDNDLLKDLQRRQPKPSGAHVIAKGEPARDESIEVEFHVEGLKEISPDASRVDFRERGFGADVFQDQVIVEQIQHGPGSDGVDVMGKNIPFQKKGMDRAINVNSNIAIEKDGARTIFRAKIDGVLNNRNLYELDLQPILHIKGKVDLQVGHLRTANPIEIDGDVGAGFIISSSASIIVRGSVEKGAILECHGPINVEGGVFAEAQLKAGGNIEVKFAQGANIKSDGDVSAEQYLYDCDVYAKGCIRCSGTGRSGPDSRGSVVGGVLNAIGGMELASVGSRSNLTTLVLGFDLELEKEISHLREEIDGLERELRRQIRLLPVNILESGWRERLEALPRAQNKVCKQRLTRLSDVKRECEGCKSALKELGSQKESLKCVENITVLGILVPDVKVMLSDCERSVYDDFSGLGIGRAGRSVSLKSLS